MEANYSYQKNIGNKDNRNLYNKAPTKGNGYYDEPISLSEGIKYDPSVRVPKLKRKTAWKRFYKLYPHLKGLDKIEGSMASTHNYGGLNPSSIKLKKNKKK